jgi:hypothetical protein
MRLRTLPALSLAALLSAVAAAATTKTAASPPPDPDAACVMCHGAADAKSAAGRSIAVDGAKFAQSVHGEMDLPCTACHAGIAPDKIPHAEKPVPVDCSGCHAEAAKQYAGSIHGAARAGGSKVAASCGDCHGTHDILRAKDPGSRTHRDRIEDTCAACHGDETLIEQADLPGGNVASQFLDGIHGKARRERLPAWSMVPTCTSCHGAHDALPKSNPASRVSRARIPETCGGCHGVASAEYENSQHGRLRHERDSAAPGCVDCHSAHRIRPHDAPQWQLEVIRECGGCHVDYVSTYRDTYHGKVTELGYTRVATCSNCHGAHQVLPKSDPRSRVSATNRLATCQACHPGANANFALYDPHANRHRSDKGLSLFVAGKFMDALLVGVFAFFGAHTLLWFFRSLREVRERKARRASGAEPEARENGGGR